MVCKRGQVVDDSNRIEAMALRTLILSSALFCIWTGCKPDAVFEDWEGDPVFYFNGTIGSDQVLLQAGREDLFMHTSTSLDTSGYWAMHGAFAPKDCPFPCPGSLRFTLLDLQIGLLESINRDLHPQPGTQSLPKGLPEAFVDTLEIFVFQLPTIRPPNFLWDFGFGDTTTVSQPERYFGASGSRRVCITGFEGNCASNACNNIPLKAQQNCRIQFDWSETSGTFTFSADARGPVIWDFGDGQSGNGQLANHSYSLSDTVVRVCATLDNDCRTRFCRDIPLGNASACLASFGFQIRDSLMSAQRWPDAAGSFLVEWRHPEGGHYSNQVVGKNPGADQFFNVAAVIDYKPNRNGLRTRMIHAQIGLWLHRHDEPKDSIRIESQALIFALPRP
jgi:hypothetical protein